VFVVAFADRFPVADPSDIYIIEKDIEGTDIDKDVVLLYSLQPLGCAQYPQPHAFSCSKSFPNQPKPVRLIAINGRESMKIRSEYLMTFEKDLRKALMSLCPNKLSITPGSTSPRYVDGIIYHLCSSISGTSRGALVSEMGEIMGIMISWRLTNAQDCIHVGSWLTGRMGKAVLYCVAVRIWL